LLIWHWSDERKKEKKEERERSAEILLRSRANSQKKKKKERRKKNNIYEARTLAARNVPGEKVNICGAAREQRHRHRFQSRRVIAKIIMQTA